MKRVSNFGADELHRVVIEVRGPKTKKQVKKYMQRVKNLLRQLPGNVKNQEVVGAKKKPKKRKPAKRRRRSG